MKSILEKYKSIPGIVDALMILPYDQLSQILDELSLRFDSEDGDESSDKLHSVSKLLFQASNQLREVWSIENKKTNDAEWVVLDPGHKNRFACLRCGGYYDPPTDQPLTMFVALQKGFLEDHQHCEPNPQGHICLHCYERGHKNEECSTIQVSSPHEWLRGTDTGISSLTIWSVMMKEIGFVAVRGNPSIPWDPDDFGRCYRLLQRFPDWRARIHEMSNVPQWRPLVDHWDELERLYEEEKKNGRCPKLYARMLEIRENIKAAEILTQGS